MKKERIRLMDVHFTVFWIVIAIAIACLFVLFGKGVVDNLIAVRIEKSVESFTMTLGEWVALLLAPFGIAFCLWLIFSDTIIIDYEEKKIIFGKKKLSFKSIQSVVAHHQTDNYLRFSYTIAFNLVSEESVLCKANKISLSPKKKSEQVARRLNEIILQR